MRRRGFRRSRAGTILRETIAQTTLRPEERDLRKRNVVEALADGAENLAEAAFVASTTVTAIGIWREGDEFFSRAIDRALEDGADMYADRMHAEAAARCILD